MLWSLVIFQSNFHIFDLHLFVAGAALPSLSAGVSGARFVCCTDYPIQGLLDNMRRNIERNVDPGMIGIYHVAGYRWGEDCRHLVELNSDLYDVVLAAECLWRHDSHEVLLRTLKMVLTRGGLAIFTFSHHIPGLEQNDLNFFEMAKGDGFQVVSETVQEAPHMWSDRLVPLKMVILKLTID